jgi:hypothetical protein
MWFIGGVGWHFANLPTQMKIQMIQSEMLALYLALYHLSFHREWAS